MTNEKGVETCAGSAADLGLDGKPMWLHIFTSPCGYLYLQANVALVQT